MADDLFSPAPRRMRVSPRARARASGAGSAGAGSGAGAGAGGGLAAAFDAAADGAQHLHVMIRALSVTTSQPHGAPGSRCAPADASGAMGGLLLTPTLAGAGGAPAAALAPAPEAAPETLLRGADFALAGASASRARGGLASPKSRLGGGASAGAAGGAAGGLDFSAVGGAGAARQLSPHFSPGRPLVPTLSLPAAALPAPAAAAMAPSSSPQAAPAIAAGLRGDAAAAGGNPGAGAADAPRRRGAKRRRDAPPSAP